MKDVTFALSPYPMKFTEKPFKCPNENFLELKNVVNNNLIKKIMHIKRKYAVHVLHKLKQSKKSTIKSMRRY